MVQISVGGIGVWSSKQSNGRFRFLASFGRFLLFLTTHLVAFSFGHFWALSRDGEWSGSKEATEETMIKVTTKQFNRCDDVAPLQHTVLKQYLSGRWSDAYNPFHQYFDKLWENRTDVSFPEMPMWDSWDHYFEAYHNHMSRFRGKELVFMEVGVQSGGKIAGLRDYFGPGFVYVGIDTNPSTKMFESADWVHIEIGDSGNRTFLQKLKQKYPHVDIFLDDGGHMMTQQMVALEEMLPHVQPEGVYICEDLATSWIAHYQGYPMQDVHNQTFLQHTMVGLVHKTIDWLNHGWYAGDYKTNYHDLPDDYFPEKWWHIIPQQVKHIHYYNQFVVYEKGHSEVPSRYKTVGKRIPYQDSGIHKPVDWNFIMKKIQHYTGSPWQW